MLFRSLAVVALRAEGTRVRITMMKKKEKKRVAPVKEVGLVGFGLGRHGL